MSTHLSIYDGTTPLLDEILKLSYGVALESLSVAGSILRDNARKSMKSKSHHWVSDYATGKRVIKKDLSSFKELGIRISSSGTAANPASMSSMLTSFLMPKSLTVVIGGKHPSATLTKYTDGKPSGSIRVKGVGKATHAILHKLNFGERNEHHSWNGNKDSMKRFRDAKYVGYHFMEDGYSAAKSGIEDALTKRYEKLLHKAVNRADVKVKITKVS